MRTRNTRFVPAKGTASSHSMFMEDLLPWPVLKTEEYIELARRMRACSGTPEEEDLRDKLILHNIALVASIARRYVGLGLEFSDLVQEGIVGLMRAVEMYDPEMGNTFSTYATTWIRQAVRRSLDNSGRTIRIPVYAGNSRRTADRARQDFTRDNGRQPTTVELASLLGVTRKSLDQLIRATQVDAATGIEDLAIKDEKGQRNLDSVAALGYRDAALEECIFFEGDFFQPLKGLIENSNVLNPWESVIIRKRWGLDDENPQTLEQIGDSLGLTRERIRQIEEKAIPKLKKEAIARGLYNNDKSGVERRQKQLVQEMGGTMFNSHLALGETPPVARPTKAREIFNEAVREAERTLSLPVFVDRVEVESFSELELVVRVVSEAYGVKEKSITEPGGDEKIAWARQVTVCMLYDHCEHSFDKIARSFGEEFPQSARRWYKGALQRLGEEKFVQEDLRQIRLILALMGV